MSSVSEVKEIQKDILQSVPGIAPSVIMSCADRMSTSYEHVRSILVNLIDSGHLDYTSDGIVILTASGHKYLTKLQG